MMFLNLLPLFLIVQNKEIENLGENIAYISIEKSTII